jgi:hypothetical protein
MSAHHSTITAFHSGSILKAESNMLAQSKMTNAKRGSSRSYDLARKYGMDRNVPPIGGTIKKGMRTVEPSMVR